MENTIQEHFENEIDAVIHIVTHKNEVTAAAEQAMFKIEVAAEAAKFRHHQKRVRKLYHWLNQIGMMLTGAMLLITAVLCFYDGGWYILVCMFDVVITWLFSRWCHRKSRCKP